MTVSTEFVLTQYYNQILVTEVMPSFSRISGVAKRDHSPGQCFGEIGVDYTSDC